MVQPLWKTVWCFLQNQMLLLRYDPSYYLLLSKRSQDEKATGYSNYLTFCKRQTMGPVKRLVVVTVWREGGMNS